jgi:CBS domain-containing protein
VAITDVMTTNAVTIASGESVQRAIANMMAANVGSVIVCDGPRVVGIFTERDVLRLASQSAALHSLLVDDVMTRDVVTVSVECDVLDAAELMGRHKIRHLPVVEGENLVGVVGIRDVLDVLVERAWSSRDPQARERAHALLSRSRGRPIGFDEQSGAA